MTDRLNKRLQIVEYNDLNFKTSTLHNANQIFEFFNAPYYGFYTAPKHLNWITLTFLKGLSEIS